MITESERVAINRDILILQLAVNLMEATDLNDEDAALLAELVNHSVVQTALEKKIASPVPVLSDTEIWREVVDSLLKPVEIDPVVIELFKSQRPRSIDGDAADYKC